MLPPAIMNMFIAISRCLLPGSGAKAMRWETAPPHQPPHQPPHRVLLYLHLAALSDHDGGGAHGVLEELHAEFYQCFLNLFNSKELLGNPKQFKKYVNCTYKVF